MSGSTNKKHHNTVEGSAQKRNGVKRLFFALLSIILEILALVIVSDRFIQYAPWLVVVLRIIATIIVLAIFSQNKTASLKIPWIMLIMAVPLAGVTLYLLIGLDKDTRKMRERYNAIDAMLMCIAYSDPEGKRNLRRQDPTGAALAKYLYRYGKAPVYQDTKVTYYSEASDALEAMLEDLAKAEKFIFMEYHAIEDSVCFHRIEEVLVDRAEHGVEVRLFYDDAGSIGFINTDFIKRMESKGIRCRVFNPFAPGINIFLNNRDHRKITVIDGQVGFTGGYNLADEYFNVTHPYGYWKDTGIRLEGPAVKSLGSMFMEMWNAVRDNEMDDRDFNVYLPTPEPQPGVKGFVQPYADSPINDENVGEEVYISIAEGAQKYVWYVSPYLIITDEMRHALSLAAKRGIDVRIITPGIPDKKLVYHITRSYYNGLVRNGVRIYEYTPGFSHCKMSVSDDRLATCGTINLDYRSLYHHFENGCVLYGNEAVLEIRKDFEEMMAVSREVTSTYRYGRSAMLRLEQLLLRFAAPLL